MGNLDKYRGPRRSALKYKVNLNPIQRGGVLTPEARRALEEWGDGYSVCDYCFEGRVDLIEKPPIRDLTWDIARFLNMDDMRFTAGCRHAKSIVVEALASEGTVVLDSLAHYTSYMACESSNARIVEVPHNGYPEFRVDPELYIERFERVERETGNPPDLAILTHVDYRYGNLADATRVGEICEEYDVPYLLNTAYTSGVMPVDGRKAGADFVACSGHKSWAAASAIGILATTYEWSDQVFKKSSARGEWSGRAFTKKELPCYGCSPVFGAPVMTLMASFPTIVERVEQWGEEVERAQRFVREMEGIQGVRQLGVRPTRHTLLNFETPGLHQIAKNHPRRGYFLYKELKKRDVIGVHPGMTKGFKINTYGLTPEELEHTIWAFKDIAGEHGVEVYD